MTTNPYPPDSVSEDDDNGTMPENVAELGKHVVGHRIVSAEQGTIKRDEYSWRDSSGLVLTLDTGARVCLVGTSDCCAYTELEAFLLHPEKVDHVITGVATTDGYTKWHIFADMGDVLELTVGWSCGNPFYYAYGFEIVVEDAPPPAVEPEPEPLTEQRVRVLIREEIQAYTTAQAAAARKSIEAGLAKWRGRFPQTPGPGEGTPAQRAAVDDRAGRGPAEEGTP